MSNESPQRADGPPLGPTTGSALDLRDLTYWGRVNGGDYCPYCMESL